MARQDIRDSVTFVVGLSIGALIGTAAALLMAPQSGKRTRRELGRRAGQWSDSATEHLGGARERLSDAREEASRLADRTRKSTSQLARGARRRVDETTDRLSDVVESGRDRLRN